MNASLWKSPVVPTLRKERTSRKARKPTVNDILKAAYQENARDRTTLLAVKHCLG
jgi:hypothetical protein